jgi:type I site-specific restriction endonuclease
MGRSPPTEERAGSYPSLAADVTWRLQQLVAGWQGAERNQPVAELHNECLDAAGPGGRHLLPAILLLVKDLDETQLQAALQRLNGKGRGTRLRFKSKAVGRFDSALVPTGHAGAVPDRWLLAIEENLAIPDQVALYGHALGHLLLNNEQAKMDRLPALDPRDGYAHRDTLAELRMLETVRQPLDRRVLETYPLLTDLLEVRDDPSAVLDLVASDLRRRLAQFGWRGQFVETPYIFTGGRVSIRETSTQHGKKLRIDALLRAEASLPLAVVQTIHAGETREDVIRQLMEYAHNRLAVPFAYLLEEDGTIHEFDWSATEAPVHAVLAALPTREALWNRWTETLGLTDKLARDALQYPYQLSGPKPRYYQEAAINRAVIAVLQAKRDMHKTRILLTLATGTGKTKIAFQLIWKLKRARAIRNVLYLTDRDWLLSQAMDNEFAPFGDARQRILGEAKTSRDIVFATYQAIADNEARSGLYHDYPRDFFDVIIVDECHRGSAQADSRWRTILEYFEGAVQIGMTATPLSTEAIQTDEYFGKPIYSYSLRAGINDGFLAPYRVRRVLMGEKRAEEQPGEAEASGIAASQNESVPAVAGDEEGDALPNDPIMEETAATLRTRTGAMAQHLAAYLRQTDPLAKTIVFCVDQDHAEKMREALEQACAEYVMRYRGYIERIVSDEGAEGKRALGRFSTPEERTPVIVTTSRLLSTGVDIPTCKNIVLARPVGSLVEFKQIIGRGSRLYEPEKTWFTIIDYAGAIKLFFDPNFDGDPELVEVEPLVPQLQPQPEEGSSAIETGVIPEQDTPAPFIDVPGVPGTPIVREDGTAHPQEQQPLEYPIPLPLALPVPSAPVEAQEEGSQQHAATAAPAQQPEGAPVVAQPAVPGNAPVVAQPPLTAGSASSGSLLPAPGPLTEPPVVVKQTRSGRTIEVIGEYVYDLGPDGKTLIKRSSYRDYTAAALKDMIKTPADLRTRWLSKEQREALRDQLEEEGVDLPALAAALQHPDVDPLDLLLHVAFGWGMPTRNERVERLYRDHTDFFSRYKPQAREMLNVILEKYIAGEAADISDTELFKVPPLADRGTFIELAAPFGGGSNVRNALKELQQLLYSA